MSPEYADEWIRKAEADRVTARRALADSRRLPDLADIACYHAEQCAEKYLKALLAFHGRSIPRIHDLVALAARAKRHRFPAVKLQHGLQLLNLYAVRIRYPGLSATAASAAKALRAMEAVRRAARAAFGRRRTSRA